MRFGAAIAYLNKVGGPVDGLFKRRKTPKDDQPALVAAASRKMHGDLSKFRNAFKFGQNDFRQLTYDQARNLANVFFFFPDGSRLCTPYFYEIVAETEDDSVDDSDDAIMQEQDV
jgi:hypothetical protein